MPELLLDVRGIEAGYARRQILFGVDLAVYEGEAVTLLGANGSGKSTLLNAVSGFLRPRAGSIRLAGRDIAGLAPHETYRHGVIQVSQTRDLFPAMTVEDNLRLGGAARPGPLAERLAQVFRTFPRLEERRGSLVHLLSGGEQQMVALGRALMGGPKLLLLDEPSGGLAPKLVNEMAEIIAALKARGIAMLIVEQNIKLALSVADRFLILREGRVAERGDIAGQGALAEDIVRSIYL
ncbi:MAG TPA: ABC transporter ATP-binding protein [Alphaproteobacteria bacterium]|nr:ABC transporter ATP-binding protein [Alphaproteobacteria bacterium]